MDDPMNLLANLIPQTDNDNQPIQRRKLCDVLVNGKIYPAYELSLKDNYLLDQLIASKASDSEVVIKLISLAMPDLPSNILLSLTRSQYVIIMDQIKSDTILSNSIKTSSTIH